MLGVVSTGEDLIDDGGVLLALLVVAVVSGVASYKIAEAKGHDGAGYFLLGLLLPIIGILVAGFMPPAGPGKRVALKRSPYDPGIRTLAGLRGPDVSGVRAFLESYEQDLDTALHYCEAGEHALAFGTGKWRKWPVTFLLTDRRFVFIGSGIGRDLTVTELDRFSLDENRGALRSPKGVLNIDPKPLFSAHELDARIKHRQDFEPYVEVVASGKLARPKRSKVDEPAATPAPVPTDTVGELERLDALHRSGAIDDDEFAELKRRVMWGDDGPTKSSG